MTFVNMKMLIMFQQQVSTRGLS